MGSILSGVITTEGSGQGGLCPCSSHLPGMVSVCEASFPSHPCFGCQAGVSTVLRASLAFASGLPPPWLWFFCRSQGEAAVGEVGASGPPNLPPAPASPRRDRDGGTPGQGTPSLPPLSGSPTVLQPRAELLHGGPGVLAPCPHPAAHTQGLALLCPEVPPPRPGHSASKGESWAPPASSSLPQPLLPLCFLGSPEST